VIVVSRQIYVKYNILYFKKKVSEVSTSVLKVKSPEPSEAHSVESKRPIRSAAAPVYRAGDTTVFARPLEADTMGTCPTPPAFPRATGVPAL
jgi:hypothetical protein